MQFVVIGLDGNDKESAARRQTAQKDHIKMGDELLKSGNLSHQRRFLNKF